MVGNVQLADLRSLRVISIPEGIEKLGCCWFAKSEIESVIIPVSVTEIGKFVFWMCRKLRKVMFAEGSKLESIGDFCFEGSGVEEVTLPSKLK